MDQSRFNLLALSLVPGLGIRRIHKLTKRIGHPEQILKMSRSQLRKLGIGMEAVVAICTDFCRREAEKAVETAQSSNTTILSLRDPEYPELLSQIYDPPIVLYLKGESKLLKEHSIAVVGARKCSIYGKQVTQKLAGEIAAQGLTIVSGLARGIDTSAHQGALQANGDTIAVLGTGIDVVYPAENRKLQSEIAEQGCLVSEFPFGVYPAPQNFPIRNRIISGLCLGTLIPEAGEFSGSLITARLTLEQNRELWAIPGNITNPESIGPNLLIKQGAQPVTCLQDVLNSLPVPILKELKKRVSSSTEPTLSPDEEKLLDLLSVDHATHFDMLLRNSNMKSGRLSQLLFELEVSGVVKQVPGRLYFRAL